MDRIQKQDIYTEFFTVRLKFCVLNAQDVLRMILILAILQNSIVRVLREIYFIPGFTLLDQRLFTNMKSQFAMQK